MLISCVTSVQITNKTPDIQLLKEINNKKSNNTNYTKMKKRVFFLLLVALMMPWAMKAQVNTAVHIDSTLSKCDSYTWNVTGATYTSDTVVVHVSGDTLYILDLTINQSVNNVVTEPIDGGCTYQWGNETITTSGTHTKTFTSQGGCDSTVTITLTLSDTATANRAVTACDTYVFYGQTYTASGTYTITDSTSNANCDSIITINLTIKPIENRNYDSTVVACEKFNWKWYARGTETEVTVDGTVITSEAYSNLNEANRQLFHPRTAERCYDSLVTVTFNIRKSQYFVHQKLACDEYSYSFSVNDSDTTTIDTTLYYTFSKTDTIRFAGLASNGCDSILVTNITIAHSPVVTISGDLRVKPNSDVTLHVSSDQPAVRFTWSDGSTDTVFTRSNVTENFDVYAKGVNNTTGCEHTSYVTVLVNQGIDMADADAISIYPNPTSARINISSNEAVKNITVFNVNGQQMICAKNTDSIDLGSLAKGTYMVRVDLASGKVVTRTVVLSK